MLKSDFNYYLPSELIAQTPLENRSASRLLTLNKRTGETNHETFDGIASHLNAGDCLVINETRVIPARLLGVAENGSNAELLLLERKPGGIWETLAKPGKRAKPGNRLVFGDGLLIAEIIAVTESGNRLVRFIFDGIFEEVLNKLGETPLPPYITEKLSDGERYQTVYAKNEGSAAAPTAGLHFTKELLSTLEQKGVIIARLTLHVGLGTFRPVKEEVVEKHLMHSEYYSISEAEAAKINAAKAVGGRIIAVGTTSARTLESVALETGEIRAGEGRTEIFIYPPYKFKAVDCLITNFHLPESTLIMLVSALAGKESVMAAYSEAVRKRYRFFSFGDAMFVY